MPPKKMTEEELRIKGNEKKNKMNLRNKFPDKFGNATIQLRDVLYVILPENTLDQSVALLPNTPANQAFVKGVKRPKVYWGEVASLPDPKADPPHRLRQPPDAVSILPKEVSVQRRNRSNTPTDEDFREELRYLLRHHKPKGMQDSTLSQTELGRWWFTFTDRSAEICQTVVSLNTLSHLIPWRFDGKIRFHTSREEARNSLLRAGIAITSMKVFVPGAGADKILSLSPGRIVQGTPSAALGAPPAEEEHIDGGQKIPLEDLELFLGPGLHDPFYEETAPEIGSTTGLKGRGSESTEMDSMQSTRVGTNVRYDGQDLAFLSDLLDREYRPEEILMPGYARSASTDTAMSLPVVQSGPILYSYPSRSDQEDQEDQDRLATRKRKRSASEEETGILDDYYRLNYIIFKDRASGKWDFVRSDPENCIFYENEELEGRVQLYRKNDVLPEELIARMKASDM